MGPFWEYWYFHIPNYLLALMTYLFIGRFALAALVPGEWDNYIWRNFCKVTDPVLRMIDFITPRIVPGAFVVLLAAFWMLLLRIVFFTAMTYFGLAPSAGV